MAAERGHYNIVPLLVSLVCAQRPRQIFKFCERFVKKTQLLFPRISLRALPSFVSLCYRFAPTSWLAANGGRKLAGSELVTPIRRQLNWHTCSVYRVFLDTETLSALTDLVVVFLHF